MSEQCLQEAVRPGQPGSEAPSEALGLVPDLNRVLDLLPLPRVGPGPLIASGPRVGVSKSADVPWRFWIDGDDTVSSYRRSPRA